MSEKNIRVLALDLDGTLTNDEKIVTPRTRAALDAAVAKGVTIVLASGRPTAGIMPLAKELGLPVIIHDREAHADTLEVLRELRPQGVLHCFSGSAEMAREAAALGMYMGFTGAVTFKNARKAPQAAAATAVSSFAGMEAVSTWTSQLSPIPTVKTPLTS